MSLRERWRRARERRRKIREAIDRKLTTEHKLAIARSTFPNYFYLILSIFFLTVGLALATAHRVSVISLGFENYFGENQWENIQNIGEERTGSVERSVYVITIGAIGMMGLWLVEIFHSGRKIERLEREILKGS